jgi:hypothetical protein
MLHIPGAHDGVAGVSYGIPSFGLLIDQGNRSDLIAVGKNDDEKYSFWADSSLMVVRHWAKIAQLLGHGPGQAYS